MIHIHMHINNIATGITLYERHEKRPITENPYGATVQGSLSYQGWPSFA